MNISGIFIAPKPGKYFFSYSGLSYRNVLKRVELQVKTEATDWVKIGQALSSDSFQTFSLQANFELAEGDQIRLLLAEGVVHDHELHFTNFVGQLLEEDIQPA
jgi:hypothetical protein